MTVVLIGFGLACGGGGGNSSGDGSQPPSDIIQASGAITANGGTIEVTDPNSSLYGVKAEVPAGALSQNTEISISTTSWTPSLPGNIQRNGDIIKLEPSGLTFSEPIKVTIPYNSANPIVVVLYDELTGEPFMPTLVGVDSSAKTLTVATRHFSYAVPVENATTSSSISCRPPFSMQEDCFWILNQFFPDHENGACWLNPRKL